MDNLPLLRDIHLPPEVSAFPPGYGWGVIALGLFAIFLSYVLLKYLYRKSRKYFALKLLQKAKGGSIGDARQISELLRRICVYKYKDAAVLFGKQWVDFLNRHSRLKLSASGAALLTEAPYVPENTRFEKEAYENLWAFARAFVGENL